MFGILYTDIFFLIQNYCHTRYDILILAFEQTTIQAARVVIVFDLKIRGCFNHIIYQITYRYVPKNTKKRRFKHFVYN